MQPLQRTNELTQQTTIGYAGAMRKISVQILLMIDFTIILFWRMPDVLSGRLWAEEGKIFFVHAVTMPWFAALLLPYGGYLNLVANAAPIIAYHAVPLEYVPWVTTGIGLAFQCCPALILICSRDEWLKPLWVRIAALLLISTPPMVSEVWLQSLHSQFHLALCCALILSLDVPQRKMAWFAGFILLLAPLCGPASFVLLPLFLIRAVMDRSWPRLSQGLILGVVTFAQLVFFYSRQAGRLYHVNPLNMLCDVYIRQIISPLTGWDFANSVSTALQTQLAAHLVPWAAVFVTISVIGIFTVALLRRGSAAFIWLFLATGLMSFAGYFGAFDTGTKLLTVDIEGRYIFLPQILAGLTLLGIATGQKWVDRWAARIVVFWLIGVGVLYIGGYPPVRGPAWWDDWIIQGPVWRDEIALWRLDHNHPVRIWPAGWTIPVAAK
jgi:hypothetical protein